MRSIPLAGAARRLLAPLALALALPGAVAAEVIALHGRVEDDRGKPIAGASVRLLPRLGGYRNGELHLAGTFPPPVAAEAKSGADGAFRLEAPHAGHWRVVVSAAGRASRHTHVSPLVEESWLEPVMLPVEAPLALRVVGPDGKPVPGAVVAANPDQEMRWRPGGWTPVPVFAHADASGQVLVSRAANDRFDVSAVAPTFVPAVSKRVGGSSVTLALRRGARRALVVRGPGGAPVAGALVTSDGSWLPLGRTGPGGRLVLAVEAGDPLAVHVEDARGATARVTLDPPREEGQPAPVAVQLAPARRVSGRVIDRESGRPLAGALVWRPGAEEDAVFADARGGYLLERIGAVGVARLHAAAAGYFNTNAQLAATATSAPTLALEPAGSLLGTVTEVQGRPLSGVEVTAAPVAGAMTVPRPPRFDTRPPRATSDARGRFRLAPLDPRSRHRVTLRLAGYAPASKEVTLPPERPGEIAVVLAAGAVATGVVVDAREQPVAGAEVSLTPEEDEGPGGRMMRFSFGGEEGPEVATAASDGEGRFRIADLAPGRYELAASARGFAATTLPGIEVPARTPAVDLGQVELTGGVAIVGRAVSATGEPVAGADVFVLTGQQTMIPMLRFVLGELEPVAVTAADGSFAIADRRPGERVDVAVRRTGYTPGRAAGVIVPTEEPLAITLRAASDLRGRVVDPRGEPVGEARLMVQVDRGGGGMVFRGSGGMAMSAGDGRFEVEDVEPGTVRLTVTADGYLELARGGIEVPLGKDVEGIELVLQPGAVVEGTVITPDGRPAIGARVGVVAEGQTAGMMLRFGFGGSGSDGDGRYRLSGVEPGRRTLEAQLEGYERGVAELEVVAGENRLDLRLGGGQEVSGRVAGPQGEPIAGATVRLTTAGEMMWWSRHSATTDDGGGFTLASVPDGSYEAVASHRDHAEGKASVTVAGAPVSGLLLELTAGGAVAGALRGLEPSELAGTRVSAQSDATWRDGEVSRDGRYRISGLTAGEWSVTAQVEGSGRRASGHVAVATGQPEALLDLDFTGGLALSGTVRHEGRPLDGALVWLAGTNVAGFANAQTDYQGRYRLENLKVGTYRLEVVDLQRGLRHRGELTLEEDREHDVELRSARITGHVLEATSDAPIAGARLELEPLDEVEPGRFLFRGGVDSDDRGAFVVGSVGEGRWKLVAQKAGYAPAELTVELAGEPIDGLELRLRPTQGVTLLVARTNGSSPDEAHVAVIDGAGQVVTGGVYPTGEGGTVRLSTVPPGTWEVVVRAEGTGVARVAALSPGPPVQVVLAPQATLEVVVPELAEDEALATVTLRGADGRTLLLLPWADRVQSSERMARGRATLHALPPGAWTVVVSAPDGRRWEGLATTVAGATASVELR